MIYSSNKTCKVPIIIDTDASCSVTPIIDNFMSPPTKPDATKMEGLNGQTTQVLSEGIIKWEIEDVNGIQDQIETTAYVVHKANVQLPSPQVYITEQAKKQNTHCQLTLNSADISMILRNGTVLKFPLQKGNNLPIMLTQQAIHPNQNSFTSTTHS